MSPKRSYHHGDLRPALLTAAIKAIKESGASAMSVRDVARRAGVTHTAVTYHFGDRSGLLAAVAADGYRRLAEALIGERDQHQSFLEMGVAYVRFAIAHPAHFEVMYHADLYDRDDADVAAARAETAALLYGSRDATDDELADGVAAWSIVHGFATLWVNGNLPNQLGADPEAAARTVASRLRAPRRRSRSR